MTRMEYVNLPLGWLSRQIEETRCEVSLWPKHWGIFDVAKMKSTKASESLPDPIGKAEKQLEHNVRSALDRFFACAVTGEDNELAATETALETLGPMVDGLKMRLEELKDE